MTRAPWQREGHTGLRYKIYNIILLADIQHISIPAHRTPWRWCGRVVSTVYAQVHLCLSWFYPPSTTRFQCFSLGQTPAGLGSWMSVAPLSEEEI